MPNQRSRIRTMNKQEQQACWRLFEQGKHRLAYDSNRLIMRQFRAFRRTAYYSHMGCWLINGWHGMTVGIESDGYTHT